MSFKITDSYYDCVVVTNIPNFYKINLYNELEKKLKLLVVFLAKSSVERSEDFCNTASCKFDFIFLTNSPLEYRNSYIGSIKIVKLLKSIQFRSLIISEWYGFEYWVSLFFFRRNAKIIFTLESNLLSKGVLGSFKNLAKKIFLNGVDIALASGPSHEENLKYLGYSKSIFILNGVGIANDFYFQRPEKDPNSRFKLLFVGRLVEDKNLYRILEAFSEVSKIIDISLTVVGTGPLRSHVIELNNSNIFYFEKFNNSEMKYIYQDHDILLLPSIKEPWGLVVEEAFSSQMPVIVSHRIGCVNSIVFDKINGVVVDHNSTESLIKGIQYLVNDTNYKMIMGNVKLFKKSEMDTKQIECYLMAINMKIE